MRNTSNSAKHVVAALHSKLVPTDTSSAFRYLCRVHNTTAPCLQERPVQFARPVRAFPDTRRANIDPSHIWVPYLVRRPTVPRDAIFGGGRTEPEDESPEGCARGWR